MSDTYTKTLTVTFTGSVSEIENYAEAAANYFSVYDPSVCTVIVGGTKDPQAQAA